MKLDPRRTALVAIDMHRGHLDPAVATLPLERDDVSSNRHPAPGYAGSMIFSENRFPLFGIMLYPNSAV